MLKSLRKRISRRLGIDIRRYNPASSAVAQFMAMLTTHGVNLVFDVGANAGQFGRLLRDANYHGRIVSFEPLSAVREELLRVSRNDRLWEIAPRAALGSEEGEIEINVASNMASSSVLNMLKAHINAAPHARYIGKESVPLRRLDALAMDYLRPDSMPFLKIDTQGYEDRVLRGAEKILDRIIGVQMELSLVPLYEGQRLFDDMNEWLRSAGFELWAMLPVFVDLRNGRLLQVDATYFRRSAKRSESERDFTSMAGCQWLMS